MAECLNGHGVPRGVAFCHTCGAPLPEQRQTPSDLWQYVSIASVVVIVVGLLGIALVLHGTGGGRERAAGRSIGPSVATADSPTQAQPPIGGSACTPSSDGARVPFGVIGTHTSCDFAGQVRSAYLAAGGHGQALRVIATSTVTHRTYRNIACSSGRYVVCVGGEGDTAKVFMGPFAE